jgi:hypothetical protein
VPKYENPSAATPGPRAKGTGEALARDNETRAVGARAEVRAGGAVQDLTAPPPAHATGASDDASERTATPVAETAPIITATLKDGPLKGSSIETEVVEGRPPKTLDVPADDGSTCRYCLADWVQSGRSAAYTFLYRV